MFAFELFLAQDVYAKQSAQLGQQIELGFGLVDDLQERICDSVFGCTEEDCFDGFVDGFGFEEFVDFFAIGVVIGDVAIEVEAFDQVLLVFRTGSALLIVDEVEQEGLVEKDWIFEDFSEFDHLGQQSQQSGADVVGLRGERGAFQQDYFCDVIHETFL